MFRSVFILHLGILKVLSGIHTHIWQVIDPLYDLSYLEPLGSIEKSTLTGCARRSGAAEMTAFAYEPFNQTCRFFNVDYGNTHLWTQESGFTIYLRDVDIVSSPLNCLDGCGFCMPIVGEMLAGSEASSSCSLLRITAPGIQRCMVMSLQQHRKPSSYKYWVGATYDTSSYKWNNGVPVAPDQWKSGQPSDPGTKQCVLMAAGGNYGLESADCIEKHFSLCGLWPA